MNKAVSLVSRCAVAIAAGLMVATTVAEEGDRDPFEGYNRMMFTFNDSADRYLIRPLARGYRAVTPDPVERSVRRVFDNIGEVGNAANSLLQGKPGAAANSTGRFVINSTLGIAGLFDVAAPMGLARDEDEDFGQTLGRWGVGSGPYLVLPLLGPSTLRDAPSRLVDNLIDPIDEGLDHVPTRNTVYGVDILTLRAELLQAERLVTGDKYIFTREVYLQRREYLVNDGAVEDDFGMGDFDEDYSEFGNYDGEYGSDDAGNPYGDH